MSDFLFGSSPDVETHKLSKINKKQKDVFNKLLSEIGGGVGNLNEDTFGLEPSKLELSSLAGLENLVNQVPGGEGPNQQGIESATGSGLEALQKIFESSPEDIDEFFTETVQKPLLEDFSEEILPALQTKHASSFFGGERREAEARSREDLLDTLVSERSRVGQASRESDLNRKVSAAGILPGFGEFASTQDFLRPSAQAGVLGNLFGLGQQANTTRQKQLDERSRRISEILATLGVQDFENVVTAQEGSSGFLSSIAPSVIEGAFSLSDERAKTHKKKIGKTNKGVPIYTFKYKADPMKKTRMGVLAQELEKVQPSAVKSLNDIKLVDLEAL